MKTLESEQQLNDLIKDGQVVLFFTADWCPDCQVIEPVLPEIENTYSNFLFIQIDRDQFIDVCSHYDVFGIPSFIAFKNGVEIDRFVSKDRKTKEQVMTFMKNVNDNGDDIE